MNPQWFRAAPLVIMLLLLMALGFGLLGGTPSQEEHNQRLIGYQVAPFNVAVLGEDNARFSPDSWQGRVAMLNVFASWCATCVAEHDVLMKIAKSGKIAIYGLAWKDKPEKVVQWINDRGNPYQLIGVDELGKSTVSLALTGVPETFVFDKSGRIAYHYSGPLTDDMADTLILPLAEKLNAQ